MYRSFITNRFLCLAVCIFFVNTSFKIYPVESNGIKEIAETVPGSDQAIKAAGPNDLYELEIDATEFSVKKTDKWIFKFIHVREQTLTLYGWYANGLLGRSFDTPHNIELKTTAKIALPYSTDIYFGDIVLKRKDVRKIKKLIKKKNVVTIIFTPHLDPGTHLSYKITLMAIGLAPLPETFEANPSPPKGFQ